MMEINKIYQGDSVSLLDSVPDKTFDLVCTDPPLSGNVKGWKWYDGRLLARQGDDERKNIRD